MSDTIRIFFCCTGVGIFNRGIESFFRESFDNLRYLEGLEATLIKGQGQAFDDEHSAWCIPRTSKVAKYLGRLVSRNSYVVEQWSSFIPIVRQIRQKKPHIIFSSDSNLIFLLYWFRQLIGVPYRLLFSNGGPCGPPFIRRDFVHQVTPLQHKRALDAGEPQQKHFLVPYGINVPTDTLVTAPHAIQKLRRKLGLPTDRPIVISVGAIDPDSHKRMDYLVQEIAALPHSRPYLILLGQMPESSYKIITQAKQLLGENNFTARSVPYEEVSQYYQAADLFTLASLNEGFGRVFLEALMYGLPCVVHDHPVMRYVLGSYGTFSDLSRSGNLAQALSQILNQPKNNCEEGYERRKHVENTFSWASLAPSYVEMFQNCIERSIP